MSVKSITMTKSQYMSDSSSLLLLLWRADGNQSQFSCVFVLTLFCSPSSRCRRVFFPSFVVMNTCVQSWQMPLGGSGVCVWDHITRHKQAIIEPRESKLFAQASEDFRAKLDDPHYSGAIFFGVCR